MPSTTLLIASIVLYSAAAALLWRCTRHTQKTSGLLQMHYGLAGVALLMHALATYQVSFDGDILNLSLHSMAILISFAVTSLFLLACLGMPIKSLGILVYPFSALSLCFALVWSDQSENLTTVSAMLAKHLLVSLLAYAVLSIAMIQSLLYLYQERKLKARTAPAMLQALPPLMTMEQLWFRLILIGFALLSLTLISGVFFSKEIFGTPFVFKHHIVLAVLGWLVYAILVVKRIRQGIRGSQAVIWTLSGFILIQLGYFGTKIVTESLALH